MSENRAATFDALYRDNPDPWNMRSSAYERDKYQATLAALPHRHYRMGIEAGCSIGELTALLAPRCARLIGIDVSTVALAQAATRNARNPNVEFLHGELPGAWPDLDADLIVLSEVLYFLTAAEIATLARIIAPRWRDGGACILVNWLGPTEDLLPGATAATLFTTALSSHTPTRLLSRTATEKYRLDVLVKSQR